MTRFYNEIYFKKFHFDRAGFKKDTPKNRLFKIALFV